MGSKKDSKAKTKVSPEELETYGRVASASDLKAFLTSLLDKMKDGSGAPIYIVSAMNYVLSLPQVYDLMDNENRELARDLWLRVKQSGLQMRNPPLLFASEADGAVTP